MKTNNRAGNTTNPAPSTPQPKLRAIGMILYGRIYMEAIEKEFDEATSCLEGLFDLIEYHPCLQAEARALRAIIDASKVLEDSPVFARYSEEMLTVPGDRKEVA